jgi:carboxymethylenebutenolidase
LRSLPTSNGKVGVFGTCSGGRHAYLAACRVPGFSAVVDCWGGRVVMTPDQLNPNAPVAPIDYTPDLTCPILGLFGADDRNPSPEQVALHEETLKQHGKTYEFHMYPDAGHGFFYYHRPNYRQEQAVDGWEKIWAFLERTLG